MLGQQCEYVSNVPFLIFFLCLLEWAFKAREHLGVYSCLLLYHRIFPGNSVRHGNTYVHRYYSEIE